MSRPHAADIARLLAVGLLLAGCGGPPRLALEPLPLQDDDRYDVPEPQARDRDDYYDEAKYSFIRPVERLFDVERQVRRLARRPGEAWNATPLDEVQDSSWFTNRIGVRDITPAELSRAANRLDHGPDVDHPWTIVAGKTQGVTPGFQIVDSRGDRYIIKFDIVAFPELSTGAEMIGTKLFWAMGFNVPENYLVRFRPEILRVGSKAKVKLELGQSRPMTQADVDFILAKAAKVPDGSIRVIASRFLPGKPKGPFLFYGVRKDDPNDVIPHEHRRELRGYQVMCAWLNHDDSRDINSLDTFVEADGRHFMRHNLIDFGSVLGSRSHSPNIRSEGYEHLFDFTEMAKSFFTLGLYTRPWTRIQFPEIRGVGNYEAERFHPLTYKADYSNPAWANRTARDAFWGAKIVMRFDDTLVRAAVRSAEFTDPAATEYMVRAICERRDRVGRFWFSRVNPLDRFAVVTSGSEPRLRFDDLAVRHGFVPPRRYDVLVQGPRGRIGSFHTEATELPLGDSVRALGSPTAGAAAGERLLRLSIRSSLPDLPTWTPRVDVTLFLQPSGELRLAAIERDFE